MKFDYVCKDVTLTEAMKESCVDKFSKFERYFSSSEEVSCVVRVCIVKGKKEVEVSMTSNGFNLRAKTLGDDFYNELDEISEKLEGQMRKVKTQVAKLNKHNSLSKNLMMEQISDQEEDDASLEIVRHKTLSLAPMDTEEALARMDALGHRFFIYLDSSTGLVNVLYERDDHGYGVIEVEKE